MRKAKEAKIMIGLHSATMILNRFHYAITRLTVLFMAYGQYIPA
jgi:hypothetical protein